MDLLALQQPLSHGEEVHRVFDDAAVTWHQTGVDRLQERPGIRLSLHLHQDDSGTKQKAQTQSECSLKRSRRDSRVTFL